MRGEWFNVTPERAQATIIEAIERVQAGETLHAGPSAEITLTGPLITGGQIRAARAILRWSIDNLAKKSEVRPAAIQRMEMEEGIPNVIVGSIVKVKSALEAAGAEFNADGWVRLKK